MGGSAPQPPAGGGAAPIVAAAAPTSPPATSAPQRSVPNPDTAQTTIGAGGGSVGLPDGSVQVVVPAGAVPENTLLRVARTAAPAPTGGQQLTSSAIDVTATGPGGAISLGKPAQVTLAFTGTAPVGLYFFNLATSTWQPVDGGSSMNRGAGTVTGSTSHFTVFGALTAGAPDLVIHDVSLSFDPPGASPTPTPTPTATPTASPTSTATPVAASASPPPPPRSRRVSPARAHRV